VKKKDPVVTDNMEAGYPCKSDTGVRGYLQLVIRRAVSIENETVVEHPQVYLASYEFAYVDRLSQSFDVSLAAGVNFFDDRHRSWWTGQVESEDGPQAFKSFKRMSVTPSVIFAPLARAINGPRGHLFTVQAGATIFLKGFHAQDFCNPPVTTCADPGWHTLGGDLVPMVRVLLDGSLLFNH